MIRPHQANWISYHLKMFSNSKSADVEKEVLLSASKPSNNPGFVAGFSMPSNIKPPEKSDSVDGATSLNQRNSLFPIYDKFDYQCHKPRMEFQFKKYDLSYYQRYCNRFMSFQSWPKSHPIRPDQLSRAGFLYTGEGDKVICPWCRIHLIEWESFDIPIDEHRRHSPYCDFIKMLFP